MVYNFNLGIGWASSGVEYAQSYRANLCSAGRTFRQGLFSQICFQLKI